MMESLSLEQLYKRNLLDKEQGNPGCLEESGEGEAGVIRSLSPIFPSLKSFYVCLALCGAHPVEIIAFVPFWLSR